MDAKQGGNNNLTYVEHRYTYAQKMQLLETFFMGHQNPDDQQIDQLSKEVGFDPEQIQLWFENRRAEEKTVMGLAEIEALKAENERIRRENDAIQETLKNIKCRSCWGSIHPHEPKSGAKE